MFGVSKEDAGVVMDSGEESSLGICVFVIPALAIVLVIVGLLVWAN